MLQMYTNSLSEAVTVAESTNITITRDPNYKIGGKWTWLKVTVNTNEVRFSIFYFLLQNHIHFR